ncbi:MAG: hypothetical protein ACHQAR_05425 [Steroidobacterales bacterium]
MSVAAPLQLDYLSPGHLAGLPEAWWQQVLGVAAFRGGPVDAPLPDIPVVTVMTAPLPAHEPPCEIWRAAPPLRSGRLGQLHFRHNEELLFASIAVRETRAPNAAGTGTPLQQATEHAYRDLFGALATLGFAHLLRVWNYFPQINASQAGSERYWQFNSARRQAFARADRALAGEVPAACALGTSDGSPFVLYAIASRNPGAAIENPRQHSAYRYPPQYGPRAPIFSRGCLAPASAGGMLFISGTASIVGHETVHAGDPAAQTQETLRNIESLLAALNRACGVPARYDLAALKYKVYLRQPQHLAVIQQHVRAALPPSAPVLYLLADICRRDLLVEIEAAGGPHAGSPA